MKVKVTIDDLILKKLIKKEPLKDEDIEIILHDICGDACDGCPVYVDWCKRCPVNIDVEKGCRICPVLVRNMGKIGDRCAYYKNGKLMLEVLRKE